MSLGIEPVPEGFLGKLLGTYGLQWTHLVIVSGVVFSSFGLERYLNPGIWILSTVAAFGFVFLFRGQIERRLPFPRAAALGVLVIGVGFTGFVLVAGGSRHRGVGTFTAAHSSLVTLYFGLLVGLPLGVAVLSYRSQDVFRFAPLTPHLARALDENVMQSTFVLESASYVVTLLLDEGSNEGRPQDGGGPRRVLFHYTVTMDVANRRKEPATYRDIFDPAGDDKSFVYATLNGKKIPLNPERLSGRGLNLTYEAKPLERFQVFVEGQSAFHIRDSELVGAYLPCELLRVIIRRPPNEVAVQVQSLTPKLTDVEELPNGDVVWEHDQGILPFQGVRVFWEPTHVSTA